MDREINQHVRQQIAASISVKDEILASESFIDNLVEVAEVCISAFRRGNRVLLAGNGGSAADAQHIAAEFVSRFEFDRPGLPSIALTTDSSMLTAIGNDYGFERVFLRQLEANGREGDVFIGISTSGNSRNILLALDNCRRLGITSIGLAGSGGQIQSKCDYVIAVPSTHTARIQESHIMIGHIICGLVESAIFQRSKQ
jgi:D-sedoheptulose 7-phosphate isomerase